jgi:hypothetical protein
MSYSAGEHRATGVNQHAFGTYKASLPNHTMSSSPHLHWSNVFLRTLLILFISSSAVADLRGQSFVNPGFESGTTGWSGCAVELNPANVYGGPNTSMVAEVDGHNDPSTTADDRLLCQTITGFTVGAIYALEFDAARRQTGPTPASVSATVTIDGVLEHVITRTGGWEMARERLIFVPTSTTHSLVITPNFTGSHGMLFDDFNLIVASPLPIDLLSFHAWPVDDVVRVEWSTATETNNAGFAVERSTDLASWEEVAYVAGAGNSQTVISYIATDMRPISGSAYYRLKQIDLDGTTDISPVRHVLRSEREELQLWPNPAGSFVHVNMDAPGRIQVLDVQGRPVQVFQESYATGTLLHIAVLPRGLYTVRSVHANAGTVKFIKE